MYTICMFMPYSVQVYDMYCTNLYVQYFHMYVYMHTHESQNTYLLFEQSCNMYM